METLWSKRGYFGLLGNDHILVHYPIISYQRIKFYRVEIMDMGRFYLLQLKKPHTIENGHELDHHY